jgi:hypothetical protein
MTKILTASMDNLHASRLGQIAQAAGRARAGDAIDTGLILLKMLNDAGFAVHLDETVDHRPITEIIAAHFK